MTDVYIDAEFDAVRIEKHFEQAVISFGAVALHKDGRKETFYSLVRPAYFKRLTPVVKKMTHLQDHDILCAEPLETIVKQFILWLKDTQEEVMLYSFGPDDRRTLMKNCELHQIDGALFDKIQDLQKIISNAVRFQGKVISPTLSLDDAKLVYDIEGAVDHNALADAQDLMMIHHAYVTKKPQNKQQIAYIVNRKVEKQLAVAKRQQERLRAMMKEQFINYPKTFLEIPLYPEVIAQFQLWEDREMNAHIHWKRKTFQHDHCCYPYEELKLWMKIELEEELPSVTLRFQYQEEDIIRKYPLKYRNATMVETILKRVLA